MTSVVWSEATLVDVARAAGVSPTTASRALHGPYDRVSQRLRSQVEAAALRLGYSADRHAQLTARRRPTSLVVVLDDLSDPFVAGAARGIVEESHERGQSPVLRVLPKDDAGRAALLRDVRGDRPRGVIVVLCDAESADETRRHLAPLHAHGAPVVILDGSDPGADAEAEGRVSAERMFASWQTP